MISSHIKNNPRNTGREDDDPDPGNVSLDQMSLQDDVIPQDLLRKYIMYARMNVRPTVGSIDSGKIETFYSQLRRASQHTGAVPIAVRHIESLFRMAEAYARMHLRETVRDDDIDMAIRVMTESLCIAQKFTYQKQWKKQFRNYLEYGQDNNLLLKFLLQDMFKSADRYAKMRGRSPEMLRVFCADFAARAKAHGIYDVEEFYRSRVFKDHDFHIDTSEKSIVKRFSL